MEALTTESTRLENPPNFKIQLMKHQLAVVQAMKDWETCPTFPLTLENFNSCYDNPNILVTNSLGILADSVGSGKTHAIVAFISSINPPEYFHKYRIKSVFIPDNAKRFRCITKKIAHNGSSLILVPHSLFHMWRSVITSCSDESAYFINTKKSFNEFDANKTYKIVLITNTFWRPFQEKYGHIQWGRWIVDEIDSIRLPNNPPVKANFTWFITATPQKLGLFWRGTKRWHHPIRNIGYVNNILQNLLGKLSWYLDSPWNWIKYMCVRCDTKFVEESIQLPDIEWHTIECEQPIAIREIQSKNIVPPQVMAHLDAGDIQGAIMRLNGTTTSNLLDAVTDHLRKQLERKRHHLKDLMERDAKKPTIESCIKDIEKKEKTLVTTSNRFNELRDENCPICLDTIQQKTAVRCCGRVFCFECIMKSMKTHASCPMCRSLISIQNDLIVEIEPADSDAESLLPKKPRLTKVHHLKKILETSMNERTLIFSEYDNTFDTVTSILSEMEIEYGILKGNGNVIRSICKRFDAGKLPVLMLNATFQGNGHNLQSADRIIIYHELPAQIKKQVIGRAQRLGRTTPLKIYQLRYPNEEIQVMPN